MTVVVLVARGGKMTLKDTTFLIIDKTWVPAL